MSDATNPPRVVTDRGMLSVTEAAQLVRVSRRTLYNWIRRDAVEYTRTVSGRLRIYTDSLFRPREEPE